jgi:hypothetical protein
MDRGSGMPDGFAILHSSDERDPHGSRLRGALQAHLGLERARAVRDLAVGLTALLSAPVWFAAVRPAWLPDGIRSVVLAAWFMSFVGLVMAATSEWRWRQRLDAVVPHHHRP